MNGTTSENHVTDKSKQRIAVWTCKPERRRKKQKERKKRQTENIASHRLAW